MFLLFQRDIFRFHVSFQGCKALFSQDMIVKRLQLFVQNFLGAGSVPKKNDVPVLKREIPWLCSKVPASSQEIDTKNKSPFKTVFSVQKGCSHSFCAKMNHSVFFLFSPSFFGDKNIWREKHAKSQNPKKDHLAKFCKAPNQKKNRPPKSWLVNLPPRSNLPCQLFRAYENPLVSLNQTKDSPPPCHAGCHAMVDRLYQGLPAAKLRRVPRFFVEVAGGV